MFFCTSISAYFRYFASLYPINPVEVINKSIRLIENANPERIIEGSLIVNGTHASPSSLNDRNVRDAAEYSTAADDLLYEVFSNLFSNSVKYTDGKKVNIDVLLEEIKTAPDDHQDTKNPSSSEAFWKISVTDRGRGIPDNDKASMFSRYLFGAKGMGLGMSIVHALVVGRYRGRIFIRDRVEGDHTKGTTIELYLRKNQEKGAFRTS